jgi:2-oxoglutarate ferredoxin oxidoreductase subunit beta
LVIGAKGTFFARTIDQELNLTKECLLAAAKHKGMAVTEALVNCMIFNDKTHALFAGDKATREQNTIHLVHGQKMLFGKDNAKGLVFENMRLKVVTIGEDGYTLDNVLTHDAKCTDTTLHSMLAAMKYPEYPVALGVIRNTPSPFVYDQSLVCQQQSVKESSKIQSVDDLLNSGEVFEIG